MLFRPRPRLRLGRLVFPAPTRPLTADEIAFARELFGQSLDTSPIRLTRDSLWSWGAPKGLFNTIHLKSSWGHFEGAGLALTPTGRRVLAHELVHLWQYQNGGHAYMGASVVAQALAWVQHRDRGRAYRWRAALEAGRPWASWNPEQQASAVERYAVALLRTRGQPDPLESFLLTQLAGPITELRAGRGAARFSVAAGLLCALALGGGAALLAALLLPFEGAGILGASAAILGLALGGGLPRRRSPRQP